MVKIACVHTGAGPAIFGSIEAHLKREMQVPYVVQHHTNPDIIGLVAAQGGLVEEASRLLLLSYAAGIEQGANIILNMCSSVGAVADAVAPALALGGVKLIRIDRKMCETAVERYKRILVVGTLRSTIEPSCVLVEECAKKVGKDVEVYSAVAEGAFGLNDEQLAARLNEVIAAFDGEYDAVVFAQASMEGCREAVEKQCGKEVFVSPPYAAKAVAEAAESIF